MLLCFIPENPVLSAGDLARLLGVHAHTARHHVRELVGLGLAEQTGTPPNLRYTLLPGVAELLGAVLSVQRFSDLSRPVLESVPGSGEERYRREIYRLTSENLTERQVALLFGRSPEWIRQNVNAHRAREGGIILATAGQANLLRVALHRAIGEAAKALQQACLAGEAQHQPEILLSHLQELDAYRRLLNTIGIQQPDPPCSVEIDLAVHRWALTRALAAEHAHLNASPHQPRRAAHEAIALIEELLAAAEHTKPA